MLKEVLSEQLKKAMVKKIAQKRVRKMAQKGTQKTNVYEGLNARKCKGRSNQKIQKTKFIYFRILILRGPSSPTKMYMKA